MTKIELPSESPTAYPMFYRSYSRLKNNGEKESWQEASDRIVRGLSKLGEFTQEETYLVYRMQTQLKSLASGRWHWVGGTDWIENPVNFAGAYNCSSFQLNSWDTFGLLMDLAMQGVGIGVVLDNIEVLPTIKNYLNVFVDGAIGETPKQQRREFTEIRLTSDKVIIYVGDSRQGWAAAYQALLDLAVDTDYPGEVNVVVNVQDVRPKGEVLKGFGGVANPDTLPELFPKCGRILNKAFSRKLNSEECCLLIDEAAVVVVAGGIRRSAGMKQGSAGDAVFLKAKHNLWEQDENGKWRIDPERDALRMSNHTRVFYTKPTLEECISAVRTQFESGEGAIQWAGEAVARCSADLLTTAEQKIDFLSAYGEGRAKEWFQKHYPNINNDELEHRLARLGLNPCVTADTWIHTEFGARQVKELIGVQHGTFVNGELFSTTPDGFFETGTKPILRLETKEGFFVRLTEDHLVLKITSQTQKKQYAEWVPANSLVPGDKVRLHNHRKIQKWDGEGTFEEGLLLGSMVGDGSIAKTKSGSDIGILRYWGESQNEMLDYAIATLHKSAVGHPNIKGHHHNLHNMNQVSSSKLAVLGAKFGITRKCKAVTSEIERGSYNFYCGFLQGIFDADGSVQGDQNNGVSIRLAQSNLESLLIVQRMLARIGIISTIYQNRRNDSLRELPDSNRNLAFYNCKANHELVISKNNLPIFQKLIGFKEPAKNEKLAVALKGYKRTLNRDRFTATVKSIIPDGIETVYDCTVPGPSRFDANGFVVHNCGEIIGGDAFFCNLAEIPLNTIAPYDFAAQIDAFKAGSLSVCALLKHNFINSRIQKSRDFDPIVGVSFTGLFDFFVTLFGAEWLKWWELGRPDGWMTEAPLDVVSILLNINVDKYLSDYLQIDNLLEDTASLFKAVEKAYLLFWKNVVATQVKDYCDRHNLKVPNRYTTIQPSGSKSLLTNASPGWHPPLGTRFIRRMTFVKDDPIALACRDYGYSIVPSQACKDDNGNLLDDINDSRVTEWLVEIPVAVPWVDLPGAEDIDITKFSALAMFDFYMQCQKHWSTHNTSATLLLTKDEIETLGTKIYEAIRDDEGYISSALLARFDAPFPRLPFENIDKALYDRLQQEVLDRRVSSDFEALINKYVKASSLPEPGPQDSACSGMRCELNDKIYK